MTERTYQLRHYTTVPGHFDGFVAWWERILPPLRARHGFTVESAYGIRERNEFLWVVSHAGDRAAFEAAERRYADSADRAAAFTGIPGWMETMDITFVNSVVATAEDIAAEDIATQDIAAEQIDAMKPGETLQ